jgi:hypothetical protein
VFVDVGFYELDREVLQQFGVAHFYATPTVLIIDPSSRGLVNDEDRHIWGNAYNIEMSSYVEYFQKWAERLAAGYAVVGPMLEARVAGNSPEEFDASWNELGGYVNSCVCPL